MTPVSPRNKRVVEAARLHRPKERSSRGQTLVEGPGLLSEALAAGVVPTVLFALVDDVPSLRLADENQIPLVVVDEPGLSRVAGTKSPRGPVGVITIPEPTIASVPGLLVAWGVSDPGNVGTMIRTAAAFNWGFGHTEGTAESLGSQGAPRRGRSPVPLKDHVDRRSRARPATRFRAYGDRGPRWAIPPRHRRRPTTPS